MKQRYKIDEQTGTIVLSRITGRVICATKDCRTTLILKSRDAYLLKAAVVLLDNEDRQVKQITLRCPQCKAYTRVPASDPTDAKRQVMN